jgi:hypothetical protein
VGSEEVVGSEKIVG